MANFYTSDHHFGHFNIIRYTNRPYKTVQEMNEDLIKKWNEVVSPEDTVYYIGDFSFLNTEESKKTLDILNGRKILIKGNHDKNKEEMIKMGFSEVHDSLEIILNNEKVLLSHYPFVHPSLNDIAKKRPNILNVRNKERITFTEEQKTEALSSFDSAIKFLTRHYRTPVCTKTPALKEEFNFMKKLISRVIGARCVNNGNFLIHGHSHSDKKTNIKAINVCTEAWGGYPVKEESIVECMNEIKHNLMNNSFKEINKTNNNEISETISSIIFTLIQEMSPLNYEEKKPFSDRIKFLRARKSLCELYNYKKEEPLPFLSMSFDEDYLKLASELGIYISKEKLEVGKFYRGYCRNARLAYWDGEKFTHVRVKFGHHFPEDIKCPEDEHNFDVFVAREVLDLSTAEAHEVEEINELKRFLKL